MSGLTWQQRAMGVCPHGLAARPYCGICLGEDQKAGEDGKREGKLEREVAVGRQTIKRQSDALDLADTMIKNLRRQIDHLRQIEHPSG